MRDTSGPPPGQQASGPSIRTEHGVETATLVERVRLLESNVRSVFAGTCLCVLCVTLLLRDGSAPPGAWVWAWAALLSGLSAWRLWTVAAAGSRAVDADNVRRRLRLAVVHASLSGALWGLLGHVAISALDPLASLIVVTVLTALVGGATAVAAHLPSVYYPYTLLIVAPVAARLLLGDGPLEFRGVGVVLVAYLGFAWNAARVNARSVMSSIELGFRNAELVRSLTESHENERIANRAKSRFLAAASHDLSQPLHSLRLRAETLRLRTAGGPLESTADGIAESVSVLGELFNATLDVSQLDAGMLEPAPRAVALAPLLERLGDDFTPIARERGLALRVGPTDAVVRTDPVLLERLLRNLLANALRYTDRGEVALVADASVDGARGGERVRVRVTDTGPGIPPDQRERVFEEFVRLDRPERDRGRGIGLGIGLGLSIVRRIARLLDIELALSDTPGGGTTVVLLLPAVAGVSSRAPGSMPARASATASDRTLLVIDDEAGVRDAMEVYLEARGCTVIAVGSGDEALAVLEETGCVPDGIVCDYRLEAGERGTDTIARLRARCGEDVPALLVTGEAGAADRPDIRDSGLVVLSKPCDPAELLMLFGASGRGPGRVPAPDPSRASRGPVETA